MAHGVLSGIGLGAVFSLSVAGIVSIVVPMEPQPAPETGFAEPVAVPEPIVPDVTVTVTGENDSVVTQPQTSLRAPVSENLPSEPAAAARAPQIESNLGEGVTSVPVDDTPVTPPTVETATPAPRPSPIAGIPPGDDVPEVPATLPQPQTGMAATLTQPDPLPSGERARAAEDAPVLPNPQALAPMIPDDSPDAEVSAAARQETPGAADVPAPVVRATEADPDTAAAEAPIMPRVLPVPETRTATVGTTPPGTTVLPQIGRPANSLITRTDPVGSDTPTQTGSVQGRDDQPIRRFAQPFENTEALPLMSIVLIDTGADLDATEIGLPALSSFPYPISFAVDASLPDAAERVARYREEGFDVLAMVNLPQGAQPADAEVSLSVALSGMPEIVGVLEGTEEGLQGSREVADQVTRILQASGHGLVTQSKGLNSMPKLAVREGVPAAPVFRDFDSEGQTPRVIRRFLDQAAFKAGQEGGVIMLGRVRPETIEALLVWGLADRAGSVALAPVSAVLLAQE